MSQENVELLRAWIEAFNRRDSDAIAQLNHPAIEWHTSAEDPDATTHQGQETVQRYLDGYIASFPDLHIEVTECFPVGSDRVLTTGRYRGRSANGVPMDWLLTTVSTIEGGRFVRVAEYFDRAEALEAVGLSEWAMSQEDVDDRPSLEAFKRAYLIANEAFNRHDFEAAFFGFHPDFVWETIAAVPGAEPIRGRRAVINGFRELLAEFPDWQVEPHEFIDVDDAILVRNLGTATGRESGAPVRQPFTQVWTFRDGRPFHVQEYLDHAHALEAVGLSE